MPWRVRCVQTAEASDQEQEQEPEPKPVVVDKVKRPACGPRPCASTLGVERSPPPTRLCLPTHVAQAAKYRSLKIRTASTIMLIGGFLVIVWAGHVPLMFFILMLQARRRPGLVALLAHATQHGSKGWEGTAAARSRPEIQDHIMGTRCIAGPVVPYDMHANHMLQGLRPVRPPMRAVSHHHRLLLCP